MRESDGGWCVWEGVMEAVCQEGEGERERGQGGWMRRRC